MLFSSKVVRVEMLKDVKCPKRLRKVQPNATGDKITFDRKVTSALERKTKIYTKTDSTKMKRETLF